MVVTRKTRDRLVRTLVEAGRAGQLVDLSVGEVGHDDPRQGAGWSARRQVPAELLADLLVADERAPPLRGLRIRGAQITGRLDLEATSLRCPLVLQDCWFEQPVTLKEAQAPVLRLPGCHLPGLAADQLETRGDLQLDSGFATTGPVRLPGARIGGQLCLTDARLHNPGGHALFADGLSVAQDMVCAGRFSAEGEISLGAHIAGMLDFSGARLKNVGGRALTADALTVDKAVLCRDGFSAHGEVRLPVARIGGRLYLDRATLENPGGRALNANGLTVGQDLYCRDGFRAQGELDLRGVHIHGDLNCAGATLSNPGGFALNATGAVVGQNVLCRDGFRAEGELRLVGAQIGGSLNLNGAALANPDRYAVDVSGATIARSMRCRDGCTADGEVRLIGTRIGVELNFNGAGRLSNPHGRALHLLELEVLALILWFDEPPVGEIDLTHARVAVLADREATWPSSLRLEGFVYEAVYEDPRIAVAARLRWLERNRGGYAPQPYEQLAASYRKAGREEDARRVAIAKERQRRTTLRLPGKAGGMVLDGLVGYGYRTWLAAVWLGVFLILGSVIFANAYPQAMTPAKSAGELPPFQPVIYTLDLLLPIVDLRQQDAWLPHAFARWWSWVSILVGWVLTTAVVAALTGIVRRG